MSPFIPHFSSECLDNIGQKNVSWPKVLKEELIEDHVNFVIQINGKKRALLKVKRDISEESILAKILLDKETTNLIKDQKIKKTIFVSNRLINIIL